MGPYLLFLIFSIHHVTSIKKWRDEETSLDMRVSNFQMMPVKRTTTLRYSAILKDEIINQEESMKDPKAYLLTLEQRR